MRAAVLRCTPRAAGAAPPLVRPAVASTAAWRRMWAPMAHSTSSSSAMSLVERLQWQPAPAAKAPRFAAASPAPQKTARRGRRLSTAKDAPPNLAGERATTPAEQTRLFLASIGYSEAVSEGVINALLQNGIPPSSLLTMVKGLAGRYEVDEDAGLQVLAASVQAELDKEHGKRKVKLCCLPSSGWSPAPLHIDGETGDSPLLPTITSMERAFVVEALEGTTLTDVAKFGTSDNCDVLGEYIECACSGIMACSTCHVVVHPDWYAAAGAPEGKVGPPSEAEQDMLDLAYEPQATSRLGCQLQLTRDLDGLVVLLPGDSHNLMDHVPFE